MKKNNFGSFFNFRSDGCKLCYKGTKMVLFVTGLCDKNCFYCPISEQRRKKDVIFANERQVKNDDDIIEEAYLMNALGTGITGGEPILKLDRVINYIKLLKNRFGVSHHIHLYTALAPSEKILLELKNSGLDEIRFHPSLEIWENINKTQYRDAILNAHKLGLSVGIEIPSIEGNIKEILSLLKEVDGFLNLNELEFSETNYEKLIKLGFSTVDDISSAVSGSMEFAKSLKGDKFHFCSSRFKDAVQLRERFKRTAKRTARDFDEITDDGTLVYGVITGNCIEILKNAEVTEDMYSFVNGNVETAWWIADELLYELEKVGCEVCVIERYPVKNGMIVEMTPLRTD